VLPKSFVAKQSSDSKLQEISSLLIGSNNCFGILVVRVVEVLRMQQTLELVSRSDKGQPAHILSLDDTSIVNAVSSQPVEDLGNSSVRRCKGISDLLSCSMLAIVDRIGGGPKTVSNKPTRVRRISKDKYIVTYPLKSPQHCGDCSG
jgi:hypothetical protein